MDIVVLFLVLAVLAVVTPRYGVDSRTSPPRRRSTPSADLAALARRVRGFRHGADSG